MAEICPDCLERYGFEKNVRKRYILSREPDLCEECGRVKPVVVRLKRRYLIWQGILDLTGGIRRMFS